MASRRNVRPGLGVAVVGGLDPSSLVLLAGTVAEAAHERHETAVVAGVAEEGVLQQLEGVGALAGIAHQHAVDEALQARRHLPIRKANMHSAADICC